MPSANPIDDWSFDDDEHPKGYPEDANAVYDVDWIVHVKWQRGSNGKKGWQYYIKWAGWKSEANTYESRDSFHCDMPQQLWKALRMPFEPRDTSDRSFRKYDTPIPLLTQWVTEARQNRKERRKVEGVEGTGKKIDKGKRRRSTVVDTDDEVDEEEEVEEQRPRKKLQKRKSESDIRKNGSSSAGSSAVIKKKTQRIVDLTSDEERDEVPEPPAKKSRASTGSTAIPAGSSSSQPRPTPTRRDSPPAPRSPPPPAASTSAAPLPPVKKKPKFKSPLLHQPQSLPQPPPLSPPRTDSHPSPPPSRSRSPSGQEPLFLPPSPEMAAATVKQKPSSSSASSKQEPSNGHRPDPVEPEEAETEEWTSNGLLDPLPAVPNKQVDRKEDARRAVAGPSTNGAPALRVPIKDRIAEAHAARAASADRASPAPPPQSSSADSKGPTNHTSTSAVQPRLAPTPPPSARLSATINLVLGSNSSSYKQTIGPVHLVDSVQVTQPSSSSATQPTLQTLLAKSDKPNAPARPSLLFEQTFSIYRAAVIFASPPDVLEYCRVIPEAVGKGEHKARKEDTFRNAVWWLEDAFEGGSISIAYLTDPSLAFILFPRSSPLCTEIKVPNELRDRVSTESLVGALVRLKRPPIAMVAAPRSSPIDVTLEHWGFIPSFIHEARQSLSILIYAPRSQSRTNLPGINRLQAILTKPDSRPGISPGSKVTILSPGQAAPEGEADMVIVHNAMPLWSLPGLVSLRKNERTRFFEFGVAKGEDPSTDLTTLAPFAESFKLCVTLAPVDFGHDAAILIDDLLPLLVDKADKIDVFIHPSTPRLPKYEALFEVCPELILAEVDQRNVLGHEEQMCVDALRFLRMSMTNPSGALTYRRFIVAGTLDQSKPSIRELVTGLEHVSVPDLIHELTHL